MRGIHLRAGVLSAALALGAVPSAFCGQGPEAKPEDKRETLPGMFPERFLEKLTERLNLSEEQQRKVKAVIEKSRPERERLEAELRALHEKLKAAFRQTKESIREALDLDQRERFDELVLRLKGRMPGHGGWKGRGHGRHGPPGEKGMRGEGGPREGPGGPEHPPEEEGGEEPPK